MRRRLLSALLILALAAALSVSVLAGDASASAEECLTGNNKVVYTFLEDCIEQIATGEQTITIFQLPVSQLGLSGPWTAEDLGVESIFIDGVFNSQVFDALYAMIEFDIQLIDEVLMAEHPFEMFWYDKVTGSTYSISLSLEIFQRGDEITVSLRDDTRCDFTLAVSREYTTGAYVASSGINYFCQVSADALTKYKVSEARAAADQIVADNAHKSDLEKLIAYKEAICDLVSYNSYAADDYNQVPFGNPWQMIYVFDGDPKTTVVCEGYSKAFQYLCNQTDFDGNVTCCTVSGQMDGGTGAGAHMWNLVHIDGASYLVDVTNCDTGTIGYPDELFLAGNDLAGLTDVDYGVQCDGQIVSYLYDTDTRSLWDDDILQLSATDYVPCSHIPGAPVEEKDIAPTCETDGSVDTVIYCTNCSAEISRVTTTRSATGHSWDEGVITTDPTCAEEGVLTFTCLHDTTHTKTESIPATGVHTDGDGNSKCDICGTVLAHTCAFTETHRQTEDGVCTLTFTCTVCGTTETASIQLAADTLSIQALPEELLQTITVLVVSYENGQMTGFQLVERPAADIAISLSGDSLCAFFLDLNTLAPLLGQLILN